LTKLRYALVLALVLIVGVCAVLFTPLPKALAQSGMGPYSWVDLGSQMRTYKSVCWEASAGVGSDACISHPAAGHLGLTAGNGGVASADLMGTATLASGTKAITFTTAYTAAPLCLITWNGSGTFTTGASLKCVTTTTTATITSSTGTDTAVVNYLILANPN